MTAQHTPEPWEMVHDKRAGLDNISIWAECHKLALVSIPPDAARIVSCVNACAGIKKPEGVVMDDVRELVRALSEFCENDTPIHPGATIFEQPNRTVADVVSYLMCHFVGDAS